MVEMRQQLASVEQWSGARSGTPDRPLSMPTPKRGRRLAGAAAETRGQQPVTASPLLVSGLAATIRGEVLPRLVLAHRAMNAVTQPVAKVTAVWSDAVIELSTLVVRQDVAFAAAFVDTLIANGTSLETVYLDVLAAAARRLGVLWTEDVCDIADVTMGLWRLREVMRGLSPSFSGEGGYTDHGRPILLLPAPGETHSFGLAMVGDFFTRAGWNVSGGPATAGRDIGDWVKGTWFSVVGFSVGCDASLDALAAGIRTVRRRSRNRAIGVMVGGPVFALHPELAAQVGADATATDGREAVAQAHGLIGLLGGRK
jgi:methanogenic corrinoid protein MtbC1